MVHECFAGLGWVDLNGKCLLCVKNSPCKSTKARMSLEFAGNPQERSLTEKCILKSWEMMLDSWSGVRFLRALNWIPGWGISVLSHTGGGDIQLYELAWSKWGFSKIYLSLVCKGCLKWEVRSSREIGDICPNPPKWLGPRLLVGPVVTGDDQVYSHAQLLLNLFIFFIQCIYIERFLWAKFYSRYKRYSNDQVKQGPHSQRIYSQRPWKNKT